MKIEDVLSRLSKVTKTADGWKACCPAHDDQNPSLSVWENEQGHARWKCWAGCSWQQVGAALGISTTNGHTNGQHKAIVAEYDYFDENHNQLFQVCRFEPKDFRQRKPDGNGGWDWTTKDVRKVLYRLPELLAADPSLPVLIVEGEKDADRLRELGMVATTCPGGAGKWRDEFGEWLRGRQVVIFPDNDEPGLNHAETLAKSLQGKAARIQIATLPNVPDKGDVSDWLGTSRNAEDLRKLIVRSRARCRVYRQPVQKQPTSTLPRIISASDLVRQHPNLRPPVIDGLLREGEVMNIIASSKVGKSWLAHSLALCVSNGAKWLNRYSVTQGKVLLIDNELHRETISYRISKVAAEMKMPMDKIDVLPLRGQLMTYHDLEKIVNKISRGQYALVVVDAHYRMLPTMSENDNQAVMAVYNLLDKFAAAMEAGWVLIHHASKGDQSEKEITDVGAGAGSQSRATDTHLILRKHEDDGCYVLEGVTRSFPPPEPVVLRWEPPLWTPDDSLSPEQLATPQSKKRKREDEAKRQEILDALSDGPCSLNKLARHLSMGPPRCEKLLNCLIAEGLVAAHEAIVRGNPTQEFSRT